jgi:hypothetical protein
MGSLEKAARALALRHGYDWELCCPVTRGELVEASRAVLLAVREDALSIAEEAFGPAGGGREADDFRQAIDQILQEKGDG